MLRGMLMLALAVACLVGGGVAQAQCRTLLTTRVQWIDAAGSAGEMLFQGTIDPEGNLDGRVYPGDGTELVVTGTVTGDGAVSGALDTLERLHVATFEAQLNAAREVEGALIVNGEVDAAWMAPADALPAS